MDLQASLIGLDELINNWLRNINPDVPSYVGESIVSVGILLAFVVLGWIIYHIFEKYFSKWAEKTKTKLDDEILKNIKKPMYYLVILLGVYYGLNNFSIIGGQGIDLTIIFSVAGILLITFTVTKVTNAVFAWYAEGRAKKKEMSAHILFVFKKIINAVIFTFALLIVLYVLKIDLSGIVVGMGVAGIAIAFALQNVLGDVFSAFSIYFDKPFEIGDFIIVGGNAGTVTKIGMKSTRVKLLQGEELVLSNRELTSVSVRNFKKLEKRRIVFHFGVTYDTPTAKLKKIPGIVEKIIEDQEVSTVDRVHFQEFGDFSLNFEIVYYMKIGDYAKYMDNQQEINFAIKEAFEKEGIEMAFPTQTIFLNKQS